MKRRIEVSGSRRAQVWIDEPPNAVIVPTSHRQRVARPREPRIATRRIVAVELNIYHGPRASYALLGAELSDSSSDGLAVIVRSAAHGAPLDVSLALQPDDVSVGLPGEFVDAVVDGAANEAEASGAPTHATLDFRWAAHAMVASSCAMFERVARMIVRIVTLPDAGFDDALLAVLRA